MSNHIFIIYTFDSQVKEKQEGKATKKSSHKFDFFHSKLQNGSVRFPKNNRCGGMTIDIKSNYR